MKLYSQNLILTIQSIHQIQIVIAPQIIWVLNSDVTFYKWNRNIKTHLPSVFKWFYMLSCEMASIIRKRIHAIFHSKFYLIYTKNCHGRWYCLQKSLKFIRKLPTAQFFLDGFKNPKIINLNWKCLIRKYGKYFKL